MFPFKVPRVNARLIYCSNVDYNSPEEYYRHTIFVPFMDGLIKQLIEKFSVNTKIAMKGMYLIPALREKTPLIRNI